MNFNQWTNLECGQRNPLAEMASHVTQDYVFQDRMGETITSEQWQNNGPPPESFRMDDLMREINQFEPEASVSYPEPSAVYRDATYPYPNQFWAEQGKFSEGSWEGNFCGVPQMTHFYGQVPQAFPNQSYYIQDQLSTFIPPSSSQSQQIYESSFNNGEYTTANILDKLEDIQENNKNVVEHPKDAIQESEWKDDLTSFKDYKFIENNPMSKITDLLQKGKSYLACTNIPNAILCFEAAVKRDETSVEAWKLLGTTWTKNLDNLKAVYALKRGLSLDPVNLEIIMELAIIYMKHPNKRQCLSMLLSWLKNHPEYSDIVPKNFKILNSLDINVHKDIQNMFLKAVQRRPINPDYLVQSALGILFNINLEFDKSIDCFHTAVKIRPKNAYVWNLLGVTLTESGKHEEGLDAIFRALTLNASGLYHCNIAISYMYSKAYRRAAAYLLLALNWLNGHNDTKPSSRTFKIMLTYLRLCMSAMGRLDLVAAVDEGDLDKLHEEFGVKRKREGPPMKVETAQKTD